ncbi:hypothetical protein ACKWTF_001133 [Chironomus riparius]
MNSFNNLSCKIFLPLLICACINLRPVVGLSLIYLTFFFVSPYVSLKESQAVIKIVYLSSLIACSTLAFVTQLIFQIKSVCDYLDLPKIISLNVLGVIDFNKSSTWDIYLTVVPDLVISLGSSIVLGISIQIAKERNLKNENLDNVKVQERATDVTSTNYGLINRILSLISIMTTCLSGAVCVSAINMIYFVTFLISIMHLASNCGLGKKFSIILRMISWMLMLQIVSIILYQIDYFQSVLPSQSIVARLLGLYEIFKATNHGIYFNKQLNWDFLLHPMVLMVSYLIIANISRMIMIIKVEKLQMRYSAERKLSSIAKLPTLFQTFIFRQAYIIAILSMVIWSISYHSWLGFVFLIISNVTFVLSNQRSKLIKMSTLISMYACLLIMLNYLYGLNVTGAELPYNIEGANIQQIGIIKYKDYPGIHLIFKSILAIPFWIIMRQKYDPITSNIYLTTDVKENKLTTLILNPLGRIMSYSLMWIIMLLLLIFSVYEKNQMSVFRITNMVLLFVFVLVFQISITLWKNIMYTYWIVLIFFTKSILIVTYIYQFDGFSELPFYSAIGLQKYVTSELFMKLISLSTITTLSGIQVNYLHAKFLKYFESCGNSKKIEDHEYKKDHLITKMKELIENFLLFLEIHFIKFLYFGIFFAACGRIQIVNVSIMMILSIGAMFRAEKLRKLFLIAISFMSMLFVVGIMLYELASYFFPDKIEQKDQCIIDNNQEVLFVLKNFTEWFNVDPQNSFYQKISFYFGIIVILTIYCGLKFRQECNRKKLSLPIETPCTIFGSEKVDITYFIKFLIDYGYQNFGVELTLFGFLILMFSRLDFISVFYAPFFVILTFLKQRQLKVFWIITTGFVASSVFLQSLIIGFFVMFKKCHAFQSRMERTISPTSKILGNLHENPWILSYDFALLVILGCHHFPTPSNFIMSSIFEHEGTPLFNNVKELLKKIVFKCHLWMMLTLMFFIGTIHARVFALGYITASFIFFWQGADFYSKPLKTIKKWWNILLIYNVCVMLIRYSIKVFGCLFRNEIPINVCWILKLLDFPCFMTGDGESFCGDIFNQTFYITDVALFFLIIFQKRIFLSSYFFDTVYDTYITNLLAARGAQIMEEIRIQEITTAIDEENKNLDIIKKKMEKITQLATEKNIRDGNIKSHDIAVRNGDYYMFEEDFLEEIEFTDREIPQKSLMLYFENGENSKKVSIETESTTEKSKEVVENFLNKSKNLTSKLTKYVLSISYKLHKLSRKHTLIIKALDEERKFLKETLASKSAHDMIYTHLSNAAERSRHTYVLKKIDEKFWKNSNVKLYEVVKPEDVTVKESLCEILYITLTHTDLLIYMVILINQCFYANILSICLPLLIFFWATLTFPRPKKTFWIILIAYTQSIIFLKCVSQFNIIWWNKNHHFVQMLGIDNRNHFVFYDLLLLLALFIHRSVQKMFGIWNTEENEFLSGSYELDKKNIKTNNLIKLIQNDKMEVMSDKIKNEVDGSTNKLLDESSSKIVMKIEVQDAKQTQESVLKEVIKSKKEFLKANEAIFNDNLGKLSIMINQGDSTIKIYPIDQTDMTKTYKINELVMVEHELEDPIDFYASVIRLSFEQYFSLLINFIKFLVPKHHIPRKSVDVYTFCFLCDFMNFFVLLFGFSKFAIQSTDDSKSILNYFEENKVPTSLLFLIIMQFIVIIIDRMLYLRKNMIGKVIFHYITIITIHSWMFFILPVKTNRAFNATSPPILFYIIKFIYFLLAAYQIRCGYPARVLGNFLMRQFNLLHLIGFKIFMAIPFLFELRTLIDWTFISTSLSFAEWMKVETIFAQVFQVKCNRELAKNAKRGEKKSLKLKIILGGGLTLLIIAIIWFPLLLFAYSPSLGQSNVPRSVKVTLRIGKYEPIYKIDVRAEQIIKFNKSDWNKLTRLYEKNQQAITFLNDFDEDDIMLVQMSVSASGLWHISPPSLRSMIDDLKHEKSIDITARYEINDLGYLKDKEAFQKFHYTISSKTQRKLLINILQGNSTNSLVIPKLLPKFIHVSSTGKASIVEKLAIKSNQNRGSMRDIEINMQTDEMGFSWWKVKENCTDDDCKDLFWHVPHHDCDNHLNIYMFTDKLFPSEISSWAAKGILGFYITVVLVCSRILRSALMNSGTVNMIVEELPSPDKILNLCRNIYMVREAKQYSLEEDLVAKLFFLYRSPETLIKWTKYKES